ncbi:MAG: hypothetical protein ABSA92_12675 [Candidatus Bathyarchaeia archaeon]
MLSLILSLILFIVIILALIWFTSRRRGKRSEPIIELEKLVHCKSCGSLIPETAGRCAFCGKPQA